MTVLQKSENSYCINCGKMNFDGWTHNICKNPCCIERYVSLYRYTGEAKGIIKDLKYFHKKDNIKVKEVLLNFSIYLASLLKDKNSILIPIPIHPLKEMRRGYNQSVVVVEYINRVASIPFNTEFLIKYNSTLSQSSLNKYERSFNNLNVFDVPRDKKFKLHSLIVLIDDIGTTGSTLISAARTIKKLYPYQPIWAATIFR